ncbi:MAG: CopG family transcriptional regulator [Dehalococcoidia bacterium]
MGEEKKNVAIPAGLYDAIDQRVRETEFNSVEEYVTFVLEEVLKDEEEEEVEFSPEDEEEVKKRLRALGYLD